MARGDMAVAKSTINDVEILNRKEFEAVSMTIVGDAVVKAGTPINKDGQAVTTTPWTGAVGILLHDVDPTVNPQGAIVKEGYIHTARAKENCGCVYDGKLPYTLNVLAGCRINFEEAWIAPVAV